MKKKLSIFLLCSLSFKVFPGNFSQDRDILTEELSKFEGLAREAEINYKTIERRLAHYRRTSYENRQYEKRLNERRHKTVDDKAFRLGELSYGHPLEVVYLQRVSTRFKKK